jgi:hypothetical protein
MEEIEIPCEKCISLAICITQKCVSCSDLFKFGALIISKNHSDEAKILGRKVKKLLPKLEKVGKW